jgi:hypothetical protein
MDMTTTNATETTTTNASDEMEELGLSPTDDEEAGSHWADVLSALEADENLTEDQIRAELRSIKQRAARLTRQLKERTANKEAEAVRVKAALATFAASQGLDLGSLRAALDVKDKTSSASAAPAKTDATHAAATLAAIGSITQGGAKAFPKTIRAKLPELAADTARDEVRRYLEQTGMIQREGGERGPQVHYVIARDS